MKTNSGLRLALALALPFQIAAVTTLFPTEIAAKTKKKAPAKTNLSRALGAVMVPVNADTIKQFKIKGATSGMMIVSMQPDGVAKEAGFLPGDVITKINGMTVNDLVTLDEIAFFALYEGVVDFTSDGFRDGKEKAMTYTVTYEAASKPLDYASIATWTFFVFDGFDYGSFYSENSVELTESFEQAEVLVEDYAPEDVDAEAAGEDEAAAEAAGEDEAAVEAAGEDEAAVEGEADSEAEAEGEADGGSEGGSE